MSKIALNGTDEMHLYVFGGPGGEQCVVAAVLDNLGKGAAGQAVQNLDLMLGREAARARPARAAGGGKR